MKALKMRGSERNLFCQKKAPPFFVKLRGGPGLLSGASSFMQLRVRRKPSQPVGRDCVVSVDFSAGLALQGDGHGDHHHGEGSSQNPNDDAAGVAGLGGVGLAGLLGLAGVHGSGFSGWATPS